MKEFTETKEFTFDKAESTVIAVPSGSSVVVAVWGGEDWIDDCTITGSSAKVIHTKLLTLRVTLTGASFSISAFDEVE